jgi:hypothetical protein
MKKLLIIIGFGLLTVILFLIAFYFIKNEKPPTASPSVEADQMALNMLESLNKTAWDATKIISWTFRSDHNYKWNRQTNTVTTTLGAYEIEFNTQTKDGTAKIGDLFVAGEAADKLLMQAWDNFNNDSFWLAGPYKVFDGGTVRSIVKIKDGRTGLKVTHTKGGTTPGDTYVWLMDENHRPTSVKMWVSVLPIGGMEFTWENYQVLNSGAMIARNHKLYGSLNIKVININDYYLLPD